MEKSSHKGLILIVEDDRDISDILCRYFERDGFRTAPIYDGQAAVTEARRLRPDLIVLDVNIPKIDGLTVLGKIRSISDVPIIMATALGEDLDKLTALRIGADDYVVKPFNPLELVARAVAVLRRIQGGARTGGVLRVGPVEVDLENTAVRIVAEDGAASVLGVTATEFRILAFMARSPERAHTRLEILENCVSESSNATERTVDSHVYNIRKKLEEAGCLEFMISVHGIGYRFSSKI